MRAAQVGAGVDAVATNQGGARVQGEVTRLIGEGASTGAGAPMTIGTMTNADVGTGAKRTMDARAGVRVRVQSMVGTMMNVDVRIGAGVRVPRTVGVMTGVQVEVGVEAMMTMMAKAHGLKVVMMTEAHGLKGAMADGGAGAASHRAMREKGRTPVERRDVTLLVMMSALTRRFSKI